MSGPVRNFGIGRVPPHLGRTKNRNFFHGWMLRAYEHRYVGGVKVNLEAGREMGNAGVRTGQKEPANADYSLSAIGKRRQPSEIDPQRAHELDRRPYAVPTPMHVPEPVQPLDR